MRAVLAAAGAAAVLFALFFARPHATPGPPMRDFEAYYAAGHARNAGENPYTTGIWRHERTLDGVDARRNELLPFVGPPATLPLWSAIARLPFPAANILWRSLLVACIAALALLGIRFTNVRPTPTALLCAAIAALGFGPVTSAAALGQIALPAFVFAAAALAWAPAGILAWAQPNVALALLSQTVRRNGIAAFAGAAAIFGAACIAVAGPAGTLAYVQLLREHGAAERFSAIQFAPGAIAYGFGASPHAAIAIEAAVVLAAIACWVLFVRAIPSDSARFCATCALLPLAMPFFHEHDLLVAFLPALYFTTRCARRVWPIAAFGALFSATDWLGLAQRPDGALQTLLLVGAAGLALIALRDDARPGMLAVPAGMLVAIALAAHAAALHPVPVWPDAMRPVGNAILAQTPAAAWHAEQAASGLFTRDAVWALLRCGSLFGCALLAYAGVVSSRYPARSKTPSPVPA